MQRSLRVNLQRSRQVLKVIVGLYDQQARTASTDVTERLSKLRMPLRPFPGMYRCCACGWRSVVFALCRVSMEEYRL